jgi:type II restriction/modification system DNA methylase subunit YeeA
MNKSAIQRFAIWARTELIAQVSQRAYQYGITKDGYGEQNAVTVGGRALTTDEQRQRKELVDQIRSKGYTQVMEEVAYTWFNRFIALRFMEVNNYLPSHIRVFSDSTGAFKPEILNDVLHLDLPGLNTEKVAEYIEKNQTEDLYRYLLLTQCNALNASLPQMFERMGGYTELLLPNNILKQDSILGHMVTDIPEEDWTDQVQIIGWLYQYYNSELKDDTFALLKKNVKITKERIPSATQLFTPDWIVRYMVENSLGRIFIDKRKNEGVFADGRGADEMTWEESEAKRIANEKTIAEQMGWKYYLPEAEQTEGVRQQLDEIQREYANLDVKEIKVIDPCMGSGHILVYAFDVLMQIYEANGYSQRDAAQSILENNLYGLDIDDRAAQLAYFAVMMKARQYDRRIFSRGIQPHVYAIVESNGLDRSTIDYFTNNDPKLEKDFGTLVDELRDAKEYGSILNISQVDFAALYARIDEVRDDISIFREIVLSSCLPLIQVAEVMAQKYDVVVTNPPYMAVSNAGAKVNDYVKKNFPDSKADMFAVFIERCGQMAKKNGYQAMITQHSWMFLSGFEKLRIKLLNETNVVCMAHLGSRAFEEISGEVVQTTAFVFRRATQETYRGVYERLVSGTTQAEKENLFLTHEHQYQISGTAFAAIPGTVFAYWVSNNTVELFQKAKRISDFGDARQGMATGDNEYFVRYWYEVVYADLTLNAVSREDFQAKKAKYIPYTKSSGICRWYGNYYTILRFDDEHYEKLLRSGNHLPSRQYYFRENANWSLISTDRFGARFAPKGSAFDVGAHAFFDSAPKRMLAYLNSTVFHYLVNFLSPTMNYNSGIVAQVPCKGYDSATTALSEENVNLAKSDWDSYETSWDFTRHPLVPLARERQEQESSQFRSSRMEKFGRIAWHYEKWAQECVVRFAQLKANEEELNRIFIDIYGLQDELTPEVEDRDVTVRKADLGRDIRSLISYAVGCMFGRYSLDEPGLAYAGGEWDTSKYSTIIPDKDNIIPICDDDYFDDDITGRFVKWVETVYGSETLEENLKFIADALGGKGTPREVIRSYFINDFYVDHLKIYQKRPIYWLFDSGKKNGFKALIYMHRYQSDLLARMRTDYVHEQQERYRTQLMHLADAIDHASASERVKLTKQQKKIQEQALEIQKYEEKVHHLADQNIQIDLDDGVKHNYELFADVLAKIK